MSDERRLDLGLLERALAQFKRALNEYAMHPQEEAYRDSVVMRYVFTYELCVQVLRRYVQLEHRKPLPEDELRTPRVIRRANALGVVRTEWEEFATFRDARNAVAHTYSEAKAIAVATVAARFAEEAQYVLDQVKERFDG
jgi:nucleotidyltransferase substrate binding protein (TIGR01987 family)